MAKIANYTFINNLSSENLTNIYRNLAIEYPKFFKMDTLAKTGFLLAEQLINKTTPLTPQQKQNTSVIIFNNQSSIDCDLSFQKTISDPDNCYPSPSLFVYTLPNIVTGEIAIRHGFMGETSFYITQTFLPNQIEDIVNDTLYTSDTILTAWIDNNKTQSKAIMYLITQSGTVKMLNFNANNLQYIYNKIS